MPSFKNRKNEKHGRLLVLNYAGKDKRNKHLWECKCDCGKIKIVVSDNLSSGKSNSCGCLRLEYLHNSNNKFKRSEDRENEILKVQYSHLKRRNKKFKSNIMPLDHFKNISLMNCFYCGSLPLKVLRDKSCETKSKKLISNTIVKASGIDRVDNKKGYTEENCVPCCKICNSAKGELSITQFLEWAKNLNRNFIGIEKDDKYFEIAKNRINENKILTKKLKGCE